MATMEMTKKSMEDEEERRREERKIKDNRKSVK